MSDVNLAAKLLRGLGDRNRLAILIELTQGERRVVDLTVVLGCSQSNVSAHLACLKDCGLVKDRPVGRQVFYAIAEPAVLDVFTAAERVLAAQGHQIALCPNYGGQSRARRAQRQARSPARR